MESSRNGVGTKGPFPLVGGAGAFRIEPCGRPGNDRGAEGSLADPDAASPAGFGPFGFGDGSDVQEGLGFLEILPGGGFA